MVFIDKSPPPLHHTFKDTIHPLCPLPEAPVRVTDVGCMIFVTGLRWPLSTCVSCSCLVSRLLPPAAVAAAAAATPSEASSWAAYWNDTVGKTSLRKERSPCPSSSLCLLLLASFPYRHVGNTTWCLVANQWHKPPPVFLWAHKRQLTFFPFSVHDMTAWLQQLIKKLSV